MYDADNLYVLAHFIDPTPLNNPGQTAGDYGFAGDCLQFRIITRPGTPGERGEHFTCWRGKDGRDVIVDEHGVKLDGGTPEGRQDQGRAAGVRGRRRRQGIRSGDRHPLEAADPRRRSRSRPGDRFTMTFEPNFTVGANGRLSVKDIFKPGVHARPRLHVHGARRLGHGDAGAQGARSSRSRCGWPTAASSPCGWRTACRSSTGPGWSKRQGAGRLQADRAGHAGGRLRLARSSRTPTGTVVRQLLNARDSSPRGTHDVKWDGLTTPNWREPGEPVPAGDVHVVGDLPRAASACGCKGWAGNGGQTPWDYPAGKGNWGGDHGLPASRRGRRRARLPRLDRGRSGQGAARRATWRATCCGTTRAAASPARRTWRSIGGDGLRRQRRHALPLARRGRHVHHLGGTDTDGPDSVGPAAGVQGVGRRAGSRWRPAAGKLYRGLEAAEQGRSVADGKTGKVLKTLDVKAPIEPRAPPPTGGCCVVSERDDGPRLRPGRGGRAEAARRRPGERRRPWRPTRQGGSTSACGDPDNQVKVFDAGGKPPAPIGRQGGRRAAGPVAARRDALRQRPGRRRGRQALGDGGRRRRPSASASGTSRPASSVKEFFGPTGYGASAARSTRADPNVMVGQGCEWRLDPATGRAACVGVDHARRHGGLPLRDRRQRQDSTWPSPPAGRSTPRPLQHLRAPRRRRLQAADGHLLRRQGGQGAARRRTRAKRPSHRRSSGPTRTATASGRTTRSSAAPTASCASAAGT